MHAVCAHRRNNRGFTLVELMIVVVVVSVLALIAIYGTNRYIANSKTTEAVQLIGSIKAAEESYKDETFTYLDVTGDLTTYYPSNPKRGQFKVQWGGAPTDIAAKWGTLGVQPAGPVAFVYACVAGDGTAAPPSPSGVTVKGWPTTAQGTPYYVVKAIADLDPGGPETTYISPSFTNQIFSANEGD
jgi:prepilin-type N-terminal cleavage/methylation domain-containing protein